MMWADLRQGLFCSSYTTDVIKMMEVASDGSDGEATHEASPVAAGQEPPRHAPASRLGRWNGVSECWAENDGSGVALPNAVAPCVTQRLLSRERLQRRPLRDSGNPRGRRGPARGAVVPVFPTGTPATSSTAGCGARGESRCATPLTAKGDRAADSASRLRLPPRPPSRTSQQLPAGRAATPSSGAVPVTVPLPAAGTSRASTPAAGPPRSAREPHRIVSFGVGVPAAGAAVVAAEAPKKTRKASGSPKHKTRAHARLAATLERLEASKRVRGAVAAHKREARLAESAPEAPQELTTTIRRLICANPWGGAEKDAPWTRVPPDKQTNYLSDALQQGARDLRPAERERMEAVFKEVARGAGVVEDKSTDFKISSVALVWGDFARYLKGRIPNVYIQRLGVYFAIAKTKIRLSNFMERLSLLITCAAEKRLRATFSLLDVSGDGIIGPRDIFATLPRDMPLPAEEDPWDGSISGTAVVAVFNAPGQVGLDFNDVDTSALEVIGVVPGLPAEQQGVRAGDVLARINEISVDTLTPADVRSMLARDVRPLKLHFSRREHSLHSEGGLLPMQLFETLMRSIRMKERISTRLKVCILGARSLRNVDGQSGGLSDPYCVCEVEGKPHVRFQTRRIDDCLDPDWNEERELMNYKAGDTLKFSVKDKDFGSKDEVLGVAMLPSSRFLQQGFDQEVPLTMPGGKGNRGTLRLRIAVLGNGGIAFDDFAAICAGDEVSFLTAVGEAVTGVTSAASSSSPLAATQRPLGKVKVALISASGLRNADLGGRSDPYCVCEIVGKPQLRFQTPVVNDTLDPVWNKRGELDYAKGDSIKMTVFDKDPGNNHEVVGHVTLTSWYLQPNGFDGEVELVDPGGNARGGTPKLTVRIALPSSAVALATSEIINRPTAESRIAAEAQESGLLAFQQEVRELRSLPHLQDPGLDQYIASYEALSEADRRLRRKVFIENPMRVVGAPSPMLAGKLFDIIDTDGGGDISVREWVTMIDRWFRPMSGQDSRASAFGFMLYDLDGDGSIGVQDAVGLSREVDRLTAVLGQSMEPTALALCEEMRELYGRIADETDSCDLRGVQLDPFRFSQLKSKPVIVDAIRTCLETLGGLKVETLGDGPRLSLAPGEPSSMAGTPRFNRGPSRADTVRTAATSRAETPHSPCSPCGSTAISADAAGAALLDLVTRKSSAAFD
mmetsp:Transcript_25054/g.72070  ORF Transcript_25054/g.72070 Transcript_25054/m.72070 type:complete len:1187 (+) Transcript_25054:37-3597(+)